MTTVKNTLLIATAATLLTGTVACKPEDAQSDKGTIWTYQMTVTGTKGKKIGGTYEYGSRKASFSTTSGKWTNSPKTLGPKTVRLDVTPPVRSGNVTCTLIVKKGDTRMVKVSDTGRDAHCVFKA